MDKNILQSLIKHQADVQAHLSKNPQDLWMVVNPLFAPYFHAKVFIESNYKGGTQQLLRDAAVALADKNTYWNILKSPFSERTQQLFVEGKLTQAIGRGAGEMSVEAGQEAAETLLTGGFGKAGMVVFGFTVDASKVARRSIKIADTVGDYSRLPRRFLPDIKVSNRSYKIKADTSKFEEGALQHIFDGSAKGSKSGKVSLQGFHHEGENIYAKVTKVLKTDKATGVYEPEVEIFGYKKDSHPKAK